MPLPIDLQIDALASAWERQISRLHLGASPYDDDDLNVADFDHLDDNPMEVSLQRKPL